MTREQLRKFHIASPFQPFRVHMANGRYIDVSHPDFMHFFPHERLISVYKSHEGFEVIDVLLVTSVETLSGNGHQKPRGKKPRR